MPQYSLTAGMHCSPLQLHQREQLAPQLSAAVSTLFLLFPLDHSQSTSLFRYFLHRRLKTLMSLKTRSSCFARFSVQKFARDVVRSVTLFPTKMINAHNRVHVVNEFILSMTANLRASA
ncbi:hypothetical protein TRVL_08736 [Trypanosoma vivax]|nr:hypothetical protein TRVL_08736 [Trypanosoma vivax]